MSDDDGDVVVMQVCASIGCDEIYNLEFDEETGESYCAPCMAKMARAVKEHDFSILLTHDQRDLVRLVHTSFDSSRKGYWTYEDFNSYADATAENRNDEICFGSNEEMREYISEEYGVECATHEVPATTIGLPEGFVPLPVVTLHTLENIYGGYIYNRINALQDDVDALQDDGHINTDVLE